MNNWETNFKNLSQMSTINQVTKQYPPTYLSVGDADPFTVRISHFIKHLNQKMYLSIHYFIMVHIILHHQYQFHLEA